MTIPAGYSTDEQFYASKYTQGSRTVYGMAMTPAELTKAIKRPDTMVVGGSNRRVNEKHAREFARYFMANEGWVSPGIILRAPSMFTFEPDKDVVTMQFGLLSYPSRKQGDLRILDGQHRILGFYMALEMLDDLIDKARSNVATAKRVDPDSRAVADAKAEVARLERIRDRLSTERVSVEIQVVDDEHAYRQMFFDIADNAMTITSSVRARFDSRKVVNRALPSVLEDPILDSRVDVERDQVLRNSPYWLTAKHVADLLRTLTVGYDGRIGRRMEREATEAPIARKGIEFLYALQEAFPVVQSMVNGQVTPGRLRETSMMGSPAFIRVLAGVEHELMSNKHNFTKSEVTEFFKDIAPHTNAPAHANSIWKKYAPDEAFNEGAFSPNQLRQTAVALVQAMADWAIDKPSWLKQAPEPAPEVAVDKDEGLDYAPDHSTKDIEVEIRNENEELAIAGRKRARAVKKG